MTVRMRSNIRVNGTLQLLRRIAQLCQNCKYDTPAAYLEPVDRVIIKKKRHRRKLQIASL